MEVCVVISQGILDAKDAKVSRRTQKKKRKLQTSPTIISIFIFNNEFFVFFCVFRETLAPFASGIFLRFRILEFKYFYL
jgi:hypothetical protein